MRHSSLSLLLALFCHLGLGFGVQAQTNRILPVEEWQTEYVARLQRRGLLNDLNPTALPYTAGEVLDALRKVDREALGVSEEAWMDHLLGWLDPKGQGETPGHAGVEVRLGGDVTNNNRRDVLRQLDSENHAWSQIGLRLFLDSESVIAHISAQHDLFQYRDPDALRSGLRWVVRNETSYAGVRLPWLHAYVGRFSHHWAPLGSTSLVLSANPEPFDALSFRVGSGHLALRLLFGMLDSAELDGSFTGKAGDRSTGESAYGELLGRIRRLLVVHRLDWRPHRALNLAYVQSAVFSSESRGWDPIRLIPFLNTALYGDDPEDHRFANLMMSAQIWGRIRPFVLFAEAAVGGLSEHQKTAKPSVSVNSSIRWTIAPRIELETRGELISARSYRSQDAPGSFVYLLRGLGPTYADYYQFTVEGSIYSAGARIPVDIFPYIVWLKEGEATAISASYPSDSDPFILAGDPKSTARFGVRLRHQSSPYWWLSADLGLNRTWGSGAASKSAFVGLIRLATRFPFTYHRDKPI